MDLQKFIAKVPKAELHLHLEGCIQLDTLWQLYQKNKVKIEGIEGKEDLAELYKIESLEQFLYFFINVLQKCVKNVEDIGCYFTDLKDYMQRNNIRYAELFFSPSKLVQQGLEYSAIADRIQQGIEMLAESGYNCQILIDVSRSFGTENAMRNLENILAYPQPGIIGIGLGGSELNGPAKEFQEVFAKAKANRLHCVAHAGEDVGSESIWDSINLLQAERIGHGISAMEDVKLRAELRQRRIPLEVCITSNTFTKRYISKAAEHPVRLFYDEGLVITIHSDDPTLFHSELCNEYQILVAECKFTAIEVLRIMENNVTTSFMTEKNKQRFIENIRNTAREYQVI